MTTSQLAVMLNRAAEEAGHSEPAVNPWIVGGITLGILLAMLLALIAFGGGREHS